MYAPLILILAASIGSAPVTPGCPATAARTWRDSENGATTSRPACLRPLQRGDGGGLNGLGRPGGLGARAGAAAA